jgi:hypothetical protein
MNERTFPLTICKTLSDASNVLPFPSWECLAARASPKKYLASVRLDQSLQGGDYVSAQNHSKLCALLGTEGGNVKNTHLLEDRGLAGLTRTCYQRAAP